MCLPSSFPSLPAIPFALSLFFVIILYYSPIRYGFHKVNKSPRGHRTLAENQIWEFSHQKFLRGRQDLLDDIKRKAMESDAMRRDGADVSSHVTMLQSSQQDLAQQVTHLQANFGEVARELADTRRIQVAQQQLLKSLLDYIQKTSGGQRKSLFQGDFNAKAGDDTTLVNLGVIPSASLNFNADADVYIGVYRYVISITTRTHV
jgi:uncharacterized protein YoxC